MFTLVKNKKKYKLKEILNYDYFEIILIKNNIRLVYPKLRENAVIIKCDKVFNKLFNKILEFILTGDDEDSGVLLLDELAREREIFLNKYAKFLSTGVKDKYLSNIRLVANELKHKSYTKTVYKESSVGTRRR